MKKSTSREARLRRLQAEFLHAARTAILDELATSIAHEVSQPLAAIITNAETTLRWLSREDPDLAKVEQLARRIALSAHRANAIVERIRQLAARHKPDRTPLDISQVVDEALQLVRHDLDSRAITLTVAVTPDLPRVLGDRGQLQQVIVNLLLNSIQALGPDQASPGDGLIEIEARSDDVAIRLSVRDDGPGVPVEEIDRLFEGFFTTRAEALGIGLTICHSIVVAHGGRITAANHPNGGAVFEIRLPAVMPGREG